VSITDEEVMALLKKWRKRLGLPEQWTFTAAINHTSEGLSKKLKRLDGQVDIKHEYYLADFTFNLWQHDNKKELEETVVHELLHVVLAPVIKLAQLRGGRRWRKVVSHAEEAVVTVLSKALIKR
jgi:hypothetical protein